MKFKSITTQITILFSMLMLIICIGLGVSAYINARNALQENIDENLIELAKADAKVISEKLSLMLWNL